MDHQQFAHEGGAFSEAWTSGGLCVYRTAGELQPVTAGHVLARCHELVQRSAVAGLVADYERARVNIAADDLLSHALAVVSGGGGLLLPTALVVAADNLPMWRAYAHLMAHHGIVRGVFTSHEAALSWVRRQAEVWEADRRSPAPARSAHRPAPVVLGR